jgi:hypothetical protein
MPVPPSAGSLVIQNEFNYPPESDPHVLSRATIADINEGLRGLG